MTSSSTSGNAIDSGFPDPAIPSPRTIEYPWMSVTTWQAKQRAEADAAARGGIDLLFVGDSLVEGWTDAGLETWNRVFVPLRAANFGIGGDTTQTVLWRLDHGAVGALQPRAVVLLIGTNNLGNNGEAPADVARGVAAVVARLQAAFPGARILVLGILPREQSPANPARAHIAAVNASSSRLADGDAVHYLDIGQVFLEADGTISPNVMPDFLHLSSEGYRRWGEAILRRVRELLG